ncbi:hypothetical protein GUITHDRAFT_105780 [Guillardia theta CCMP2712]|uniref:Apple domain-containing protein n=1 Tax=Guillardia theta (strain CCMP2712) TaxID=905079 RepID=L1JKL7_GUITC|nr:hypothetical protein GUITHDRAFT_105780 [Guillardia theta CCMP2712]EKX48635.1 hypothetical protein GUITHDRAFT_105780 [Guillardia theta CCMP2712]|eukprot:XP_005835615.1 hypothetical protein GUITHDRAFT_105780 [Guillardia theta CCMP2712]
MSRSSSTPLLLLCLAGLQFALAYDVFDGYYPALYKVDFIGNDIPVNGTIGKLSISMSDCATLCNATSECRGFTYQKRASTELSSCFVKSMMVGVGTDTSAFVNADPYSYIRRSVAADVSGYPKHEVGYDYPGNDIQSSIAVKDAAACGQECNKATNCAGFVYYPIPFSGQIYNQQATVGAGTCAIKTAMKGKYQFPAGSEIQAYHKSAAPSTQSLSLALSFLTILFHLSLRSSP